MKEYANGMKATTFTKKQINVLYGKAKRGEVKVERWAMSELYDLADYYGYDYNGSIEMFERYALTIIRSMFGENNEAPQETVDRFSNWVFSSYTTKKQDQCNHELV